MKKYRRMRKLAAGGFTYDDAYNGVIGLDNIAGTTGTSINAGLVARPSAPIDPGLKKPASGGGISAGAIGGAAALGTGLMDAIDTPNQYGNNSTGVTIGKGALGGAASGAVIGSAVPGIGTAIGAAAGAVIGGVSGLLNAKKMRRKERELYANQLQQHRKYDNAVSQALATDPSMVEGSRGASYYKNGGTMYLRKLAFGGPGDPGTISGKPILPDDNYRLRKIDSLSGAWGVPTNKIYTTSYYNYGDSKAIGGIPRRMDYNAAMPDGTPRQFIDYYEGVTRGSTDYVNQPKYGPIVKREDGGSLIKPSHRGKFTRWAQNHDMSVSEATSHVLANKDNYSEGVRKMAQFSRNFGGHENGGLIRPDQSLMGQKAMGGTIKGLNSNGVEFVGNNHENGGIQLPAMGAEVENNETAAGNFVFSDNLGFAKLHRPIAKAIGKIEKKPQTPDRINALQLLRDREERLALNQESYKRQKGIS